MRENQRLALLTPTVRSGPRAVGRRLHDVDVVDWLPFWLVGRESRLWFYTRQGAAAWRLNSHLSYQDVQSEPTMSQFCSGLVRRIDVSLRAFPTLWTMVSGHESLPPSQVRSPGRHVAQHQDFQTLPRCKHPFPEGNALFSARFGFSGRFAEQIRSAMNQYGRSDIFWRHFIFVGQTDRALRTAVRVLDIRSRSNPSTRVLAALGDGSVPSRRAMSRETPL